MNKYLRWLKGQLPSLVERGVIGAGDAARIRAHYRLDGGGDGSG